MSFSSFLLISHLTPQHSTAPFNSRPWCHNILRLPSSPFVSTKLLYFNPTAPNLTPAAPGPEPPPLSPHRPSPAAAIACPDVAASLPPFLRAEAAESSDKEAARRSSAAALRTEDWRCGPARRLGASEAGSRDPDAAAAPRAA